MRAKFSELDARIGDVAQNVQRGDTGLPGEYIKFFLLNKLFYCHWQNINSCSDIHLCFLTVL